MEGPGTWSPFDVVGHLIHGERTDWVPRVEHMLRHGDPVPFPAFDREAMFAASKGLSLSELLDTFGRLRTENLDRLVALRLTRRRPGTSRKTSGVWCGDDGSTPRDMGGPRPESPGSGRSSNGAAVLGARRTMAGLSADPWARLTPRPPDRRKSAAAGDAVAVRHQIPPA